MRLIAGDRDVVVVIVEDRRRPALEFETRQCKGLAGELLAGLVEVIEIEVAVAAGPDEIAGCQIALLRHHLGQQCIGRDVERHAEKDIGAALIELARQPAVGDIELEQRMAGRKRHLGQLGHVPGRDDQATGIGIALETLHELADLVDVSALGRGP